MSSNYQKTASDKTNILAPREYFLRPFDFQDWTEMRFGLFFGGVTAGGDNTQSVSESVAQATVADKITVGLKNSDTNDLPGQAGSLFIGAMSFGGEADCDNQFYSNVGGSQLSAGAFAGTSLIGGSVSNINQLAYPANVALTSAYNGFWAIKFVINNLGLSTQSVTISTNQVTTVAGTDYSASALRTLINNAVYAGGATLAWNDGAAARVIPDAVWIRLPFYNNRIRISCMMGVRYAP